MPTFGRDIIRENNPDKITGDDTFIINDIALSIPPTKISISKSNQDFRYDMMRSSGPIYIRSGRGVVTMNLDILFNGKDEMHTLQRLVAEISLTPFVHIENEHVRANMAGAISDGMNMAWVVRAITINTAGPELWQVSMVLDWFNYMPYSSSFTFIEDFAKNNNELPKPTVSLASCKPWKKWVENYISHGSFTAYHEPTNPLYDMSLAFIEFSMTASDVDMNKVSVPEGVTHYSAFTYEESDQSRMSIEGQQHDIEKEIQGEQRQLEDFIDNNAARLGTNSVADLEESKGKVIDVTMKSIAGHLRDFGDVIEAIKNGGWRLLTDEAGNSLYVTFRSDKGKTTMVWRPQVMQMSRPEIVITDISLSIQHHYARLPIVGYNYATVQYLGGVDRGVNISMLVTGIEALKSIQQYWETLQQQVLKLRQYTSSNVVLVENNFLNALGIDRLIPQAMEHSTIEGQPGTYMVSMMFVAPPADSLNEQLEYFKRSEWSEDQIYKDFLDDIYNSYIEVDIPFSSGKKGWFFIKNNKLASKNPNDKVAIQIIRDDLIADLNDAMGDFLSSIIDDVSLDIVPFEIKRRIVIGETNVPCPAGQCGPEAEAQVEAWMKRNASTMRLIGVYETLFNIKDELAGDLLVGELFNDFITKYISEKYKKGERSELLNDQGKISNGATWDSLSEEVHKRLKKAINEFNSDVVLSVRKVMRKLMGILPQFKKYQDRLAQMGVLKGGSCYPDMKLDVVKDAYQLKKEVNPDFYFYPEGVANFDAVGVNAMFSETQEFVNKQWDWLVEDTKGSFVSWIKDDYLQQYLDESKRKQYNENIKKMMDSINKINTKYKDTRKKKGLPTVDKVEAPFDEKAYAMFDGTGFRENATKSLKDRYGRGAVIHLDGEYIGVDGKTYSDTLISEAPDFAISYIGPGTMWTSDDEKYNSFIKEQDGHYINKRENFAFPLGGNPKRTGAWGKLRYTHKAGIQSGRYVHEGQDWQPTKRTADGGADGPIYAIYDGVVASIKNSWSPRSCRIKILHSSIGLMTVYEHIDRNEVYVRVGESVKKGQKIGKIYPHKDSASISNYNLGHLHFETWIIDRAKLAKALGEDIPQQVTGSIWRGGPKKSNNVDPKFILYQRVQDAIHPKEGGVYQSNNILAQSMTKLIESMGKNNMQRMNRAFPSYKLFFIEEDTLDGDGRRLYQFDDLFGWAAVYSIDIHRSEDNPVDTAIIVISNVSGNLSNRRFGHDTIHAYDNEGKVVRENKNDSPFETEKENPIKSFFLQEGLKVLIRLGYDADVNNLEDVLVGTVSGVQFNETTDMLTITVDSYGYELVQRIQGGENAIERSSGWLFFEGGETQSILSDMLYKEEVRHFGRWELGDYNYLRSALTNRWQIIPNPVDDNIFAPDSTSIDGGGGIIFEHQRYFIYRTTIWDIFQEMTCRHPECITMPVPYKGRRGPRMTMFFGIPSQLYFSRDTTLAEEADIMAVDQSVLDPMKETTPQTANDILHDFAYDGWLDVDGQKKSKTYSSNYGWTQKEDQQEEDMSPTDLHDWLLRKGISLGTIRPFRNYHLATSWSNIVANNIKATPDGVYNAISLQYSEMSGTPEEYEAEDHMWDSGLVEIQAHWTIPEHLIKERYVPREQIYNCETWDLAQRYALKFLRQGLRNVYKGELVILGNPEIKPHDIVYIVDLYSDVVGPIEVGSVTHHISKETGFVTIIKPRLIVNLNEWASMNVTDALGVMLQGLTGIDYFAKRNDPYDKWGIRNMSMVSAGANIAMVGGAALVAYAGLPITASLALAGYGLLLLGGRKFLSLTQFGTPVSLCPLIMHGRELLAGTGFRYTKNGWWARKIGQVWHWYNDGKEGIREIVRDWTDKWSQFWTTSPLDSGGHIFGRIR